MLRYLVRTLSFDEKTSRTALRSALQSPGASAEGNETGGELAAALDWLCLHLEDDKLAAGFRPRREHPAEALRLGSAHTGGSMPNGRVILRPVGNLTVVGAREYATERRRLGLLRLGFSAAEATNALSGLSSTKPHGESSDADAFAAEEQIDLLLAALGASSETLHVTSATSVSVSPAEATAVAEARADELTALSAIFGENMSIVSPRHIVIDVTFLGGGSSESAVELHVLLPPPSTTSKLSSPASWFHSA